MFRWGPHPHLEMPLFSTIRQPAGTAAADSAWLARMVGMREHIRPLSSRSLKPVARAVQHRGRCAQTAGRKTARSTVSPVICVRNGRLRCPEIGTVGTSGYCGNGTLDRQTAKRLPCRRIQHSCSPGFADSPPGYCPCRSHRRRSRVSFLNSVIHRQHGP